MAKAPPPSRRIDHYSSAFKQSAERLVVINPLAWAGIQAAIRYLLEFKRTAAARSDQIANAAISVLGLADFLGP